MTSDRLVAPVRSRPLLHLVRDTVRCTTTARPHPKDASADRAHHLVELRSRRPTWGLGRRQRTAVVASFADWGTLRETS